MEVFKAILEPASYRERPSGRDTAEIQAAAREVSEPTRVDTFFDDLKVWKSCLEETSIASEHDVGQRLIGALHRPSLRCVPAAHGAIEGLCRKQSWVEQTAEETGMRLQHDHRSAIRQHSGRLGEEQSWIREVMEHVLQEQGPNGPVAERHVLGVEQQVDVAAWNHFGG